MKNENNASKFNMSFYNTKTKSYNNFIKFKSNNDVNNDKIIDCNQYMKNMGGSCAPLQAPSYTIPISGECKKEFKKVMDVYTGENFNTGNNYDVTDIQIARFKIIMFSFT